MRPNLATRLLPCFLYCSWLTACQVTPHLSYKANLVEVNRLEPGVHLDIRYATKNNFTGHILYKQARALLLDEPARALVRAHSALGKHNYGILIYDAYRPWRITKLLWDSASDADRRGGYVANPGIGSRHNRGCAVDVGLYDLTTGREIVMPSGFDDFSERAHADWEGATADTRRTRDMLRQAMEAEGYTVLANEWWHFDYRGCDQQPALDIPFESIKPLG